MARFSLKFHVPTLFLCGSHKKYGFSKGKTEHLGKKKAAVKIQSSIRSKALMLSKMVSWKKKKIEEEEETMGRYENDYDEDDDDEEAIWKKGIIKGEKCRPLDFSGKILYDADGNRLPDSPHRTKL